MLAEGSNGPFEIDGVPENDGGNDQVQAACAVALILERAVAQITLPIEEHGTSQRISGLAFIESDLNTSAEVGVFHPLQHEKGSLYASDLSECGVKAVLARVAGELANDEGGGDRAVPDGRSQSQYLFPLRSDQLQIELAANQRSQCWVIALLSRYVEMLVGEVADARRETEASRWQRAKTWSMNPAVSV